MDQSRLTIRFRMLYQTPLHLRGIKVATGYSGYVFQEKSGDEIPNKIGKGQGAGSEKGRFEKGRPSKSACDEADCQADGRQKAGQK